MSTIALERSIDIDSSADAALRVATKFWFITAVVGQWLFFYYIAGFYGASTLQGNFDGWTKNTFLIRGYVAGDTAGNLAFAAHALLAGITSFGGALQLIPRLRARFPRLHRWNGRLFFVTAIGVSITGLYMVWLRSARLSTLSGIGVSLNGVLIIIFGVVAWRYAMRGQIAAHRPWAMRTYLVANGQWFIRIAMFAMMMLDRAHMKLHFRFWTFACYLLPLAVLEIYLRVKNSGRGKFAFAAGLIALTLFMCAGIAGIAIFMWIPMVWRA